MARSSTKAASESGITPAGEETLDFDDVTLRGKKYVTSFYRTLQRATSVLILSSWVACSAGVYWAVDAEHIPSGEKGQNYSLKDEFFYLYLSLKRNKFLI